MCHRDHKVLSHQTSGGTAGLDEGYPGRGGRGRRSLQCLAAVSYEDKLCSPPPSTSQRRMNQCCTKSVINFIKERRQLVWENIETQHEEPRRPAVCAESAGKQEKFTDDWNAFELLSVQNSCNFFFCPWTCSAPLALDQAMLRLFFHNNKVHESLIKQKAASTLASVTLSAMWQEVDAGGRKGSAF